MAKNVGPRRKSHTWKLILAIIFLIGGIGNIKNGAGIVIFGIVLAVGFGLWWAFSKGLFHKESDISSLTSGSQFSITTPLPSSPLPQKQDSDIKHPEKHPSSEQGMFHKESHISAPASDCQLASAPSIPPKQDSTIKRLGKYPRSEQGHPLKYHYLLKFDPLPGVDVKKDILVDEEKIVSVKSNGDQIDLVYNGQPFGVIRDPQKAEMLSDWERKQFPANAVLYASGSDVNLRFYRDMRVGNEYREQTLTPLTSFKGKSKQEILSCLNEGDELELEEDYEHENSVTVSREGEEIGKLPQKLARKYLESGAYGAFIESVEWESTDNGGDLYVPTVRIYW